MGLLVQGKQVESVVRKCLREEGYKLSKKLTYGQTGADITAKKDGSVLAIECIGFQVLNSRSNFLAFQCHSFFLCSIINCPDVSFITC